MTVIVLNRNPKIVKENTSQKKIYKLMLENKIVKKINEKKNHKSYIRDQIRNIKKIYLS